MSQRLMVLLSLEIAFAFFSAICGSYAEEKPNIIFVMADDIGLGDIGRHHTQRTKKPALAATPTLDALANQGLWCTDAHSPTALCSPSRYAVMTGNYNYRSYAPWGVWGTFRESAIKQTDATLGTVCKDAGYRTGFVGKWHLGGDFNRKNSQEIYRGKDRGDEPLDVDMHRWIANGPQDHGFDYDYTVPTGVQGPVYVAFENGAWSPLENDSKLIHFDKESAKEPFYVSDKGPGTGDSNWNPYQLNQRLAEKAARFITSSSADDKPFFLCYWSPAVHIPHSPPKELDGSAINGTTPTRHTDMIKVLDWEVSKIVRALKATGEYENSIIVFSSDNGGLIDKLAAKSGHLSNGGIRGNKNHPYEGGHRVPLIVVWPGKVKANSRTDALINGTDLLATLADITGTKLQANQALDSYSFFPLLNDDPNFKPREELLLQAGSKHELIYRKGKWKLIIQSNRKLTKFEPKALFDLEDNPLEAEEKNLVHDPGSQAIVQQHLKRYHAVRNSKDSSNPKPR